MADEKTYYLVPILSDEKEKIREANVKEQRKQVVADIFKTKRPKPSETEFFLLLIQETIFSKDFLFGFVIQFHSSSSSLGPRRKQEATAFASFAFQNDGTEMFLAFHDKIKNTKKIPKREGIRILGSGLKDRYLNIHNKIWEALNMAYTAHFSKMKTPIQIQQDNKIIKSYVDDLKKGIKQQDLYLKDQIDKAREQFLQSFVSKPSLSLKKVSKNNRQRILQERKAHQEQLLQKYGKMSGPIPQQIDPYYRKTIINFRMEQEKKRRQQQQLVNKMKPFKQQIQLFVRSYEHDPKSLTEEVVLRQLGLLDPVTLQRIDNPVILPTSSRTIVEKKTLQKITEDPISRDPLPQNKHLLQVNRSVSETIQSVKHEMASIIKSSLPLDVKVFKLIQLRENTKQSIDDVRFPQKIQKKKKQQIQSLSA